MKYRNRTHRGSHKKAQWMITYLCPRCRLDAGRTEIDGPYCFYCECNDGLVEIAREPMSREAIAKRLKISSARMMENLRKAYSISIEEWPQDEKQELMLLEALAKGQDLQRALQEMKIGRETESS